MLERGALFEEREYPLELPGHVTAHLSSYVSNQNTSSTRLT